MPWMKRKKTLKKKLLSQNIKLKEKEGEEEEEEDEEE